MQDNTREKSYEQFQRTQFLARSFHACPNIKISGKSTAGNSRQDKFRKQNVSQNNSGQLQEMVFQIKLLGNFRKGNYRQCNYRQFQARKFQSKSFQEIPGKETPGRAVPGNSSQGNFRQFQSRQFQAELF